MNKKALKPLLITAIVLVVCVGLVFLLRLLPDSDANVSATPSATGSVSAVENIYLVNDDYYSLKSVEVDYRDTPEENLTLSTYTDEEGTRQFKVEPSEPGWNYDREKMSSTAWNAVAITALAVVNENPDDLAYYDLENPRHTIDIAFNATGDKAERSYSLKIGKQTALGDSFYGMIDNDPKVYAVAKYAVQKLITIEKSYRELNFFDNSGYIDEATSMYDADGDVTYLRLFNEKLGLDIEVRQRSAEELKGTLPAGTTTWHMLRPVVSECNDTNVEDALVDLAIKLTIDGIVTDNPDESTLEEYGFDDPIELWLDNTKGQNVHYYIGKFTETGECYLMSEGCKSILHASGFDVSLLNVKYVDYMFKLLWIHSIKDLRRIEFDIDGNKRLLDIQENYKDEEGNEIFYATLDGRVISDVNAKRLFTYAMNFMILGDMDEEFNISAKKPDSRITIQLTSGDKHTIELYAMNERRYAASMDGEDAQFYINATDVKELKRAFEYYDRGEEIPRAN